MMEHPLGGPNWKLMAEQIAAVTELAAGLALEVQTLKIQLETMAVQRPEPLATWQPRNWRTK